MLILYIAKDGVIPEWARGIESDRDIDYYWNAMQLAQQTRVSQEAYWLRNYKLLNRLSLRSDGYWFVRPAPENLYEAIG